MIAYVDFYLKLANVIFVENMVAAFRIILLTNFFFVSLIVNCISLSVAAEIGFHLEEEQRDEM